MSNDRPTGSFDRAGADRPTGSQRGTMAGLPVEQQHLLDEACDGFEAKWRGRGRPDIPAALLELPEVVRPVALRELVALDVFYRRQAGEAPRAEDYTNRFPELDPDWLVGVLADADRSVVPQPGMRVGDFVLLSEIGRGGMGIVYRARPIQTSREVAIKMLLAGLFAAPALRARFKIEAEAVAGRVHPHVVTLFTYGEYAGHPYLAMEYLTGGNLDDRVKASGPWPSRRAAELVAKLAAAVAWAHSNGVIHRDITPRNVLFGADDEPRLADFGLAKVASMDLGLSETGQVLGVPAYMSPEMAAGKIHEVGTPADVYALGAVLYYLLTGRAPFSTDSRPLTLQKVLTEEPIRPGLRVPTIDRDLEAVCLKCLEKRPHDRYPTAQALADDLGRYLRWEPTLARPVGPVGRLRRWVRRNRGLTWAIGIVATAILTGAAVSVAFGIAAQKARDLAESRRRDVDDTNAQLRDRVSQLRLEAYPNELRVAHESWRNGDLATARTLLNRHLPQHDHPDLRGFEWYYLDALLQDTERVVARHGAALLTADVSRNGLVASGDKLGTVQVTELATGRKVWSFRYPDREVTCVRFSPNGKLLAVAGTDQIVHLWSVDNWSEVRSLRGHTGTVTGVAWSADSSRIASAGRDNVVKIWDAEFGVWLQDITHPNVVRCVAWSGRNTLSTGCADGLIRTGDPDDGSFRTWRQRDGDPLAQAFSPDGRRFASGGYSRTVRIINMISTGYHWVVRSADHVWSLAFHPDSRHLIAGGQPHIQLWDTLHLECERWPLRTWECGGRARAVAFTSDTEYLVTAIEGPNEVRVRPAPSVFGYTRSLAHRPEVTLAPTGDRVARLTSGRRVELVAGGKGATRTLPDHTQGDAPLVFTPRGDCLLTTDPDRTVTAWDAATASRVRVVLDGKLGTKGLAVSPDGAWVVGINRDGQAHVARLATGELVRSLPGRGKQTDWPAVAFSPDGTTLATAACGVVTLWRVGTWDRLTELREDRDVRAMGYSPNSEFLVTVGDRLGVILWNVGSGRELARLRGHEGCVTALAFAPDGRTLATAGEDDTVRLWHVATRRELFMVYRHHKEIHWVQFASNGRLLIGTRGSLTNTCEVYTFPPSGRLN